MKSSIQGFDVKHSSDDTSIHQITIFIINTLCSIVHILIELVIGVFEAFCEHKTT